VNPQHEISLIGATVVPLILSSVSTPTVFTVSATTPIPTSPPVMDRVALAFADKRQILGDDNFFRIGASTDLDPGAKRGRIHGCLYGRKVARRMESPQRRRANAPALARYTDHPGPGSRKCRTYQLRCRPGSRSWVGRAPMPGRGWIGAPYEISPVRTLPPKTRYANS